VNKISVKKNYVYSNYYIHKMVDTQSKIFESIISDLNDRIKDTFSEQRRQ
jgi:hypothetical protein